MVWSAKVHAVLVEGKTKDACSISDVLFTGGKGVSDFSVLKYY